MQKKGYAIEANPNTKITDEQYDLLVKEFSTDKDLKLKTERFIQERQSKERNKASVAIDGYDKEAQEKPKTEEVVKAVVPEDVRPKFKPVGKIDLDKLNRKHTVEKEEEAVEPEMPVVEEVKAEEPAPVVEAPKPEPFPNLSQSRHLLRWLNLLRRQKKKKLRRWLQNPYRFLTRSLLPLQPKKLFRKIKKKKKKYSKYISLSLYRRLTSSDK